MRYRSQFVAVRSRNSTTEPSERTTCLLQHVVDGFAVQHGSGTAGVVRHHAADGRAACGRNVGREAQVVRLQLCVQFVEDDTGLDANPTLLDVQFQDLVVVLRSIDLNSFADRLSGLRRAASAHR